MIPNRKWHNSKRPIAPFDRGRGLLFSFFLTVVLVLNFVGIALANNTFPGTTITGNSGSLLASNVGATGEAGEPVTFGGGNLNSMWYTWTAPASGQ